MVWDFLPEDGVQLYCAGKLCATFKRLNIRILRSDGSKMLLEWSLHRLVDISPRLPREVRTGVYTISFIDKGRLNTLKFCKAIHPQWDPRHANTVTLMGHSYCWVESQLEPTNQVKEKQNTHNSVGIAV